jgi:hypothetical protein
MALARAFFPLLAGLSFVAACGGSYFRDFEFSENALQVPTVVVSLASQGTVVVQNSSTLSDDGRVHVTVRATAQQNSSLSGLRIARRTEDNALSIEACVPSPSGTCETGLESDSSSRLSVLNAAMMCTLSTLAVVPERFLWVPFACAISFEFRAICSYSLLTCFPYHTSAGSAAQLRLSPKRTA